MSRKTIAFTMPAAGARSRERAPLDLDASADERAPFAARDGAGADGAAIAAESEEWVQDRNLLRSADPPAPAALGPPREAAVRASATIDLAAERNLIEVASLSLLVPFALGWFWFVNAMAGRHRMWGA